MKLSPNPRRAADADPQARTAQDYPEATEGVGPEARKLTDWDAMSDARRRKEAAWLVFRALKLAATQSRETTT